MTFQAAHYFAEHYAQYQTTRSLMVQGCTSDAGKSILSSGICRVLANKGIHVAPFKPQNMALNSAVTIDGGEIGRAQALQAIACRLKPHSDMNPVLLKPTNDTNAQVILQGTALDNMQADTYHHYKTVALEAVMESYHRLKKQHEYIVIEGAGSPAEINLRDNDIANMGFAEKANCPVILVADIDRGGVFAHLVGTLELLSESEQNRVLGFIINRFRGDISLLKPGLDWLEARTQKPVLGVIPYLHDLFLDAEDAISTQNHISSQRPFKVCVPVLPKISNHTDFDSLRLHPQVDLQFIRAQDTIDTADLIILPGSKNTIDDTLFLLHHGWKEKLAKHLDKGGKIIGICGGMQMLGEAIHDPDAIENHQPISIQGFGLLPIETTLQPQKKLSHTEGVFCAPALLPHTVKGYEIHCGRSQLLKPKQAQALIKTANTTEGYIHNTLPIIGTYLHGLFDSPDSAQALLQWAGLKHAHRIDIKQIREQQLERLADCLEQNIVPYFWQNLLQR